MCRDIRSSICDGEGSKTIAVSLIRSPCPDRTVCAISGVAIHHNSYVERRPGPGLPSSKVQACLLSVKGRRYSARVSARSWLSAMATELQTGTRVSAQVLDTQEAREETAWAPLHACWLAAASKLLANDDLLLDYTSLQSLQSLQLRKSARCSSSFQVHDVCRMNRRTDGAVPPAVFLAYLKKDSATHNTLQTSRTIDSDRGVTVSRSVPQAAMGTTASAPCNFLGGSREEWTKRTNQIRCEPPTRGLQARATLSERAAGPQRRCPATAARECT